MHDNYYCSEEEPEKDSRYTLSEPDILGFQSIRCEGECTGVKINMDAFNLPKDMVSKLSTAELLSVVQKTISYRNEGLRD